MSSPLIDRGRAALRDGDAAGARRAFGSALAEAESGEALEGLAQALYLEREYAEAAQLLAGLDRHPDAVATLAAFHLARGQAALARDLLERATAAPDDQVPSVGEPSMAGPPLALLVDVHLAQGELEASPAVLFSEQNVGRILANA